MDATSNGSGPDRQVEAADATETSVPARTTSSRDAGKFARYALNMGWDPIPLHGIDADGHCTCGMRPCKSAGKHPLDNGWQTRTRLSKQDTYGIWDSAIKPTNVGLRTGHTPKADWDESPVEEFWALDTDPKDDGPAKLAALEAEHGVLPTTWTNRTGSGGHHRLFSMDFDLGNSRGELPKGIDVRGTGGFIVAPGSVSGKGPYSSDVAAPIVAAPSWLLDAIKPKDYVAVVLTEADGIAYADLDANQRRVSDAWLATARGEEVARLDAMAAAAVLGGYGYTGEPWDETTFMVACNLIEIAQSPWTNYTIEDVKADLRDHAPTDAGFTLTNVMSKFAIAASTVAGKGRPAPRNFDASDSWELLTAGVRALLPTFEKGGEVVATWPRERWDQVGNVQRTLRMADGRLALVGRKGGGADWMECRQDGVWVRPLQKNPDDAPAKWCRRAMEAATALEAAQYDTVCPPKPTQRDPEAKAASEQEKFLEFMKSSSKMEMHYAVAAQLRTSAEDWGIIKSQAEFDTDPYTFACASGLIDLRTGDVRPIERDDLISVASPVAYDPAMSTPVFDRYWEQVHPDAEVRDYLIKAIGYSMTGVTDEEKIFLHFGATTANGKSVFMNLLKSILGGYMKPAGEKTIIRQRAASSQRIGQDMVDLIGPRLLMLNETGEGGTLESETVKSITSGDLRADRPHAQANLEYRVTGKVHLVTNHLPHITPDQAMKRRVVVIPWTQSFFGREDPRLKDKLRAEYPGILAKFVGGAVEWYAEMQRNGKTGLVAPPLIQRQIDQYFEDEDEVASWLASNCVMLPPDSSPRGWSASAALYIDYERWRREQFMSGGPLSGTAFGKRLSAKGFEAKDVKIAGKVAKHRPLLLSSCIDAIFGGDAS